jgi:hypothetical protein
MSRFDTRYFIVSLRETVRSSSEKSANRADKLGQDKHHGNFHDDRLLNSNVFANR